MKITIEEDGLPSWNKFYSGMHWAERRVLADRWHWLVRSVIDPDTGMATEPVNITITVFVKAHPQDPDNICDKLIIDGLVESFILPMDSPGFIRSVTTKSRVDKEHPRIEIEIGAANE